MISRTPWDSRVVFVVIAVVLILVGGVLSLWISIHIQLTTIRVNQTFGLEQSMNVANKLFEQQRLMDLRLDNHDQRMLNLERQMKQLNTQFHELETKHPNTNR